MTTKLSSNSAKTQLKLISAGSPAYHSNAFWAIIRLSLNSVTMVTVKIKVSLNWANLGLLAYRIGVEFVTAPAVLSLPTAASVWGFFTSTEHWANRPFFGF